MLFLVVARRSVLTVTFSIAECCAVMARRCRVLRYCLMRNASCRRMPERTDRGRSLLNCYRVGRLDSLTLRILRVSDA